MKILIVSMGPGETAQGTAVAQYLINQGDIVEYGLILSENQHFVDHLSCKKHLLPDSESFIKIVKTGHYDSVLLCNSKSYKRDTKFIEKKPDFDTPVYSLDSNWLFKDRTKYPYILWLDKIFLNFTEDIFLSGLRENGGHYEIDETARKKIIPIGFIPTYNPVDDDTKSIIRRKYNIKYGQKYIFSYFGSGVTNRSNFAQKFFNEIGPLLSDNLRMIYVGQESTPHNSNIIQISQINSKEFYELLGSSDMVVQHQGLGTLEQCISARVPVINIVRPATNQDTVHAAQWEVEAFKNKGLCEMIGLDQVSSITFLVKKLMNGTDREKMIKFQKSITSAGEKTLIDTLRKYLQ